ncbi:hypothetical protein [Acerihabitans sp.]|uniref:hypothetical protein n=1 Tax=Acerihabitans sp. TaxID=2811394 RepID=UPI002EDAF295
MTAIAGREAVAGNRLNDALFTRFLTGRNNNLNHGREKPAFIGAPEYPARAKFFVVSARAKKKYAKTIGSDLHKTPYAGPLYT